MVPLKVRSDLRHRTTFRAKLTQAALGLASLVVFALSQPALAQEPQTREQWLASYRHFGLAAAQTHPFQEFNDDTNTGYGAHAMCDFPVVPLLNFTADLGWNRFDREAGGSLDVVNFTFGGKIAFGPAYMGGETGYYSKVDEWSWVPSFGLRPGNLDFCVRLKATGQGTWTTLRLGYYFF
jgi:hypothetical protein